MNVIMYQEGTGCMLSRSSQYTTLYSSKGIAIFRFRDISTREMFLLRVYSVLSVVACSYFAAGR